MLTREPNPTLCQYMHQYHGQYVSIMVSILPLAALKLLLQHIITRFELSASIFSVTPWYDWVAYTLRQYSVCIFWVGLQYYTLPSLLAVETTDHSISFYILWWIFQPCCTLCCNGTSTHKDTHGRLFKDSARAAILSFLFVFCWLVFHYQRQIILHFFLRKVFQVMQMKNKHYCGG